MGQQGGQSVVGIGVVLVLVVFLGVGGWLLLSDWQARRGQRAVSEGQAQASPTTVGELPIPTSSLFVAVEREGPTVTPVISVTPLLTAVTYRGNGPHFSFQHDQAWSSHTTADSADPHVTIRLTSSQLADQESYVVVKAGESVASPMTDYQLVSETQRVQGDQEWTVRQWQRSGGQGAMTAVWQQLMGADYAVEAFYTDSSMPAVRSVHEQVLSTFEVK